MSSPGRPLGPRLWALLICCSLLSSCRAIEQRRVRARSERIVQSAQELADAGRAAEALELLEGARASEPEAYDEFALEFASAWLHTLLASVPGKDAQTQAEHLGAAARLYERALGRERARFDVEKNLSLVLIRQRDFERALELLRRAEARAAPPGDLYVSQLLQASIWLDPENPRRSDSEAVAAYRRAIEVQPEDTTARERLMNLLCELVASENLAAPAERPWSAALVEASEAFEQDGFEDLAAAGYEALLQGCAADAADLLSKWVELQTRRNGLSLQAVARLASGTDCPQVQAGIAELETLVRAPQSIGLTPERFEGAAAGTWSLAAYWADRDKELFLRATESVAQSRAFAAAGLEAGPRRDGLLDGVEAVLAGAQADAHNNLPTELRGMGIEVALDRLILLHTHRERLDPDRTRLMALITSWPLDGFLSDFKDPSGAGLDTEDEERLQLAHTVLGLVYAEIASIPLPPLAQDAGAEQAQAHAERVRVHRLIQQRAWTGRAELHLNKAVELASLGERGPQPKLDQAVGDGLVESIGPLDAYLEAVRGYQHLGATRSALDVYDSARAYTEATDRRMREIEDLVFPREGLYVGIAGGLTDHLTSSGDFQKKLADSGKNARVSLDGSRSGLKAYMGYRLNVPIAFEVGYTWLEGLRSTIVDTDGVDTQALADQVGATHPIAGEGVSFSALVYPIDRRVVQAFVRGGAWLWDSDSVYTVLDQMGTSFQSQPVNESGFSPLFGLGMQFNLGRGLRLRLEAERYWLDRGQLDFFSLGLMLNL